MAAPASAGSAVVAGYGPGYGAGSNIVAVDAASGVARGSVVHNPCDPLAGGASVQADGTVLLYTMNTQWPNNLKQPEEQLRGALRDGVGSANGYPVRLYVDVFNGTAITPMWSHGVWAGDWSGSLSHTLALGPGARLFWPFANNPVMMN
jgi:hypothetical protein